MVSDTEGCMVLDMPRRPKDPVAAALAELKDIPDRHNRVKAELAARRLELIHVLLDAGWRQSQIARELGVTPVAISKLLIRERKDQASDDE